MGLQQLPGAARTNQQRRVDDVARPYTHSEDHPTRIHIARSAYTYITPNPHQQREGEVGVAGRWRGVEGGAEGARWQR
jgi:hypothetical protein